MLSKVAPVCLLIAGAQAVKFQADQPSLVYMTTTQQVYNLDANLEGRLIARAYSVGKLQEWDQASLKFIEVENAPA